MNKASFDSILLIGGSGVCYGIKSHLAFPIAGCKIIISKDVNRLASESSSKT